MEKKVIFLSFIILIGFAPKNCLAKYSGGDGSPATPYRIADANDMNNIGLHQEDWDSHFVMVNDVNLAQFTGTQFNIIGYYNNWQDNIPFTGVFDGNGFAISNFTYQTTDTNGIGLFGYIEGPNVVIKDLGLIAPNVDAGTGNYVGALAGRISFGNISGCCVKGGYVSGNFNVGGLLGYNNESIENCNVAVTVSGNWGVGGLVGYNFGSVSNCHATGAVDGNDYIGGLVGIHFVGFGDFDILNCYATGNVNGNDYTGGLVGSIQYMTYSVTYISDCYATGNVSGNNYNGGLVGNFYTYGGILVNCYATGTVDGNDSTGGLLGRALIHGGGISNCYATGTVDGNDSTGGLAGSMHMIESGMINCYAAGAVIGNDPNTGGLVGYNAGGLSYWKCFWESTVNSGLTGIGNTTDPNVIGKSTADMQKESTFTDWDFIEIWNIGENQTYPFLRVYPAGDLNHDGRVDGRDLAIIATRWLNGI